MVPCRPRRTPSSFPSHVTAFRGRSNGASPATKMPTKTNMQIRPGILARIIFLVAYDVAGRKLASGLIDYKPGRVKAIIASRQAFAIGRRPAGCSSAPQKVNLRQIRDCDSLLNPGRILLCRLSDLRAETRLRMLQRNGYERTLRRPDKLQTLEQASTVIVGGGVVGSAIARALSARWTDVFVLEALPKRGGTIPRGVRGSVRGNGYGHFVGIRTLDVAGIHRCHIVIVNLSVGNRAI